jgi:hypothetical protein
MAQKRTIDIDINTNADQAAKEFDDLGKATNRAAKSVDNLDATFEEVYGELQPLTTRMGEAEDRLYELSLAGDTASKEYQQLLEKVGQYRKVQIQTDLAVDGAATTLGQKLGSALNGVTSGFAATQGAMALFGSENEALEKTLVKVQAALAIQQGVDGLRNSYKELGGKTGIATKAQAAFNYVLNLNPLVRWVAIIGVVIAGIVKFTSVLDPAIDKLKEFSDWVGLTDFAEEERETERQRRRKQERQREKERMAAEKAIFDFKQQAFDDEIAIMDALGKSTFKLTQQKLVALGKEKLAKLELLKIDMENTKRLAESGFASDIYKEQLKEQKIQALQLAAELKSIGSQVTVNFINEANKRKEANKKNTQENKQEERKEFDLKIERLQFEGATEIEITKQTNDEIENQMSLSGIRRRNIDRKTREEQIENAKAVADAQLTMAHDSLGAIGQLANAFAKDDEKNAKKAFNINKAVGIAQAVVSTAQGIMAQLAVPQDALTGANFVKAGIVAATGAAQIATISKSKFQGGGGETPSLDTSGGDAQAPSFNVVGDSSVNQLAQLQQQPVQAFVVSGEVTTSQALDRNRVENATL